VDESSEASYGCAVPVVVYERPRVALPAATQPRPRHRYVIVLPQLFLAVSNSFVVLSNTSSV